MSDFLYHHGVKGMKWGVRKDNLSRSERLSMREDQEKIRRSEWEKADNKYGLKEKWAAAEAQAKKVYDRSGIDAIGRDKKYQKLFNDYDRLNDKAEIEVGRKTVDTMIKKYGKQKYEQFDKAQKRANLATAVGVLVGFPTLMMALPTLGYVAGKVAVRK